MGAEDEFKQDDVIVEIGTDEKFLVGGSVSVAKYWGMKVHCGTIMGVSYMPKDEAHKKWVKIPKDDD